MRKMPRDVQLQGASMCEGPVSRNPRPKQCAQPKRATAQYWDAELAVIGCPVLPGRGSLARAIAGAELRLPQVLVRVPVHEHKARGHSGLH